MRVFLPIIRMVIGLTVGRKSVSIDQKPMCGEPDSWACGLTLVVLGLSAVALVAGLGVAAVSLVV